MKRPLRLLLLEDSAAEAAFVLSELERAGLPVLAERVEAKDDFVGAVRNFAPDVVLCEHALAQFSAPAALEVLRALRPSVPLIVVSGALDERAIVACLRAGADDIVHKGNLGWLPAAIESALDVRRPLEKLTPRQLQVLRLVAEGHTTREIASHLGLSVKTIETHRGEIMKRLGLHDVVALVRYAVRVRLVSPESQIM